MTSVSSRIAFCAVIALVLPEHTLAGSITIDGSTPTSIQSAPGGATRVIIAPANAKGHSRNTYKSFNVAKPGVVLDNSNAAASLILNEVTSQQATSIAGTLSVEGTRADVVIANPNGITVNGGRFVNTGKALLVTGARAGSNADGLPLYSLKGGALRVGVGGVSSDTGSLHLASPLLQIDGPVVSAADGNIQLLAGRGSLSVGNQGVAGWLDFTQSGQGGRILLSNGARLSGGAITMQASGAGAVVSFAGQALAQAGNFVITSDGQVQVRARVTASKTISVNGAQVSIGTGTSKTTFVSQNEAVQIRGSKGLSLENVHFTGGGQGFFGFDTQASIALFSDANVNVNTATFKAVNGTLEATAGKALSFSNVTSTTGDDVLLASRIGTSLIKTALTVGEAFRLTNDAGAALLDQTTVSANLGLVIKSNTLTLRSTSNTRSSLVSKEAGVVLDTGGDLINEGGLIQGRRILESELLSKAAITVSTGGDLILSSVSGTSIGAFYGEESAINIDVKGDIKNYSGRFLGDTDVTLRAGGQLLNAVAQTGEDVAGLELPGDGYVSFGTYTAGREIGQITAKGKVTLFAADVSNKGGEITGENVTITAKTILTQPERLGWQYYRKVCFLLFFCRRIASENVVHDGGTITATDTLILNASEKFTLYGATLSGTNLVRVNAPVIDLRAYRFYEFFERRAGLAALFRGKHAVRLANFKTGTIISEQGDIELNSDTPVYDENTQVAALGEIKLPAGRTQLGFGDDIALLNERRWGIFRSITKGSRK